MKRFHQLSTTGHEHSGSAKRTSILAILGFLLFATSQTLGTTSEPTKSETKEKGCAEKREALKQAAAAASTTEVVWSSPYRNTVKQVPGTVGGKTASDIEKMPCSEIDRLYGDAVGGGKKPINGSAVDKNGNPVWGKQEKPQSPPSHQGIGSKGTPPNGANKQDKPDDSADWVGPMLQGLDQLFNGGSGKPTQGGGQEGIDSTFPDGSTTLTPGTNPLQNTPQQPSINQAGLSPAERHSEAMQYFAEKSPTPKLPKMYKGTVGGVQFGVGQDKDGWYSTILGGTAGVQTPGVVVNEEGFSASAGPFGISVTEGYVEPFTASGEVFGYVGPGGSVKGEWGKGVSTGHGVGIGGGASIEANVGFSPFKSRESFDWFNNDWRPPLMEPRWR